MLWPADYLGIGAEQSEFTVDAWIPDDDGSFFDPPHALLLVSCGNPLAALFDNPSVVAAFSRLR